MKLGVMLPGVQSKGVRVEVSVGRVERRKATETTHW